jgi:hypothetical protein
MEWHVRLAWLNHPVAAIDYVAPQPTPTPAPSPTPTATPTPTPIPTGPSFMELLRHANRAMASVSTLHAEGSRTSVDSSSTWALRIQADCRSSSGPGLPIELRTVVSGRYSSGGQTGRIDDGYSISGPVIPQSGSVTRVRERSAKTLGRWQRVNLQQQWGAVGLDDPTFGPNPAYTNQACPNLIRLTYLAAPILPNPARWRVLGLTTLAGHRVWHLREKEYYSVALDLFVDAGSYRLRRLLLSGRPSSTVHWEIRFDYSSFNGAMFARG